MREIFDIVGKARRENGQTLSEDEVRSRAAGAEAFDVTSAVYDLFFSTGRLDTEIVSKVVELSDLAEGSQEIDGFLQRVNIAFVFTSDGILGQLEQRRNASVRSYPDSPRVQIAALSVRAESERLSLDLRRRDRRAVMMSPQAETAYYTRVFQGVLDGTLERVLVNYVAAGAPNREQVSDTASTSVVFENAKTAGVPIVLLTGGNGRIPDGLPEDTLARMREDVSRGYLVIAPQGPVDVDGTPGLAWWRIDPRSGETTAITSDGLHAATTEYMIVKDRNAIHIIVKQTGVPSWTGYQFYEFHSLYGALRFINGLIAAGATMFALP